MSIFDEYLEASIFGGMIFGFAAELSRTIQMKPNLFKFMKPTQQKITKKLYALPFAFSAQVRQIVLYQHDYFFLTQPRFSSISIRG